MKTFVIAGTGVTHPVASLVYRRLCDALDAKLITLPKLGFGSCRNSVKFVRDILSRYSGPIRLVGHSQGGVIAMGVANDYPVEKVVTLGAPIIGCPWAPRWSPLPIGIDLAPHSKFLTSLNVDHKMLAVGGSRDVVVPALYASRHDMASYTLPVGHMELVTNGPTLDVIGEWLDWNLPFDSATTEFPWGTLLACRGQRDPWVATTGLRARRQFGLS